LEGMMGHLASVHGIVTRERLQTSLAVA